MVNITFNYLLKKRWWEKVKDLYGYNDFNLTNYFDDPWLGFYIENGCLCMKVHEKFFVAINGLVHNDITNRSRNARIFIPKCLARYFKGIPLQEVWDDDYYMEIRICTNFANITKSETY